jgi:SprT-like family
MRGNLQPDLFDGDSLIQRLHTLGLRGVCGVELHENTSVMVSVTPKGILRVHRGYAYAPDSVLTSIVEFVKPRIRRIKRRALERGILAFPVEAFVPRRTVRRRHRPPLPEDRQWMRELVARHKGFNAQYFGGALPDILFRVSRRMHRRLGEVLLDHETNRPVEIAISLRHLLRDGWQEVEHTLLHEMIHQWQAETGHPIDHGPTFRQVARSIGIQPRATRSVGGTEPVERHHLNRG